MTILQAIILGIIQGLTEFLPVSSTAHLLIVEQFLGLQSPTADHAAFLFIFDVLVQMGTTLALVVYFWKDLVAILRALGQGLKNRQMLNDSQARLGWYIGLASLPALAAGVIFKDQVERLFQTPMIEATIRLVMTTILLGMAEWLGKRTRGLANLSWKDALWIGGFQVLSVFPGASRSGSTLAGGITRNLERPAAARFAFLLSIPVMIAAGAYQGLGLLSIPNLPGYLLPILVGTAVAGVVGYLAIRWLLGYVAKHSLVPFAVYCAVMAVLLQLF